MFAEFDLPGYRLTSKEAALQWAQAELRDLKSWRTALDIGCNDQSKRRGDLRRDFWKFLVRQGKVLGLLMALHRVGMLTAEQYVGLRNEANLLVMGVSQRLREG